MRFLHDRSPETQRVLRRCYTESQPHRVRQRAHGILLRCDGRTTTDRMDLFDVDRLTISPGFDAWDAYHGAGLSDQKGRGRHPKLPREAHEKAPQYIEQYPQDRTKVVYLLAQETSKRVSPKPIKRRRKKTALSGNA